MMNEKIMLPNQYFDTPFPRFFRLKNLGHKGSKAEAKPSHFASV